MSRHGRTRRSTRDKGTWTARESALEGQSDQRNLRGREVAEVKSGTFGERIKVTDDTLLKLEKSV
jgi:hypothetical protein